MSFQSINTGLLVSKTVSTANDSKTVVKAIPGKVYKIVVNNANAAVRYLKMFNRATNPTVGTTVPDATFAIPPGTVQIFNFGDNGWLFSAGIAFCLTTEATDAGSTGVSASEHVVNIFYI